MLSDPTGLTSRHSRVANRIEERGLSMIDVTHHGHHRRPHNSFGFQLSERGLGNQFRFRLQSILSFPSEFWDDEGDGVKIQLRIHGGGDPFGH